MIKDLRNFARFINSSHLIIHNLIQFLDRDHFSSVTTMTYTLKTIFSYSFIWHFN